MCVLCMSEGIEAVHLFKGSNTTRKVSENGQEVHSWAMLYKRVSGARLGLKLGDSAEHLTREGVDPPQLGSPPLHSIC